VIDPTAFRAYVESLPAGTAVPVVREQLLEMMGTTGAGDVEPDLTVAQVGVRFGRSASTVRGWILAGHLSAYKFQGHELRVTRASLAAFVAAQRDGVSVRRLTPLRASRSVDLAAYRHAS
jgi:excisionase family DNA binding protein